MVYPTLSLAQRNIPKRGKVAAPLILPEFVSVCHLHLEDPPSLHRVVAVGGPTLAAPSRARHPGFVQQGFQHHCGVLAHSCHVEEVLHTRTEGGKERAEQNEENENKNTRRKSQNSDNSKKEENKSNGK